MPVTAAPPAAAAKPARGGADTRNPSSANASANAPLSLSPQGAPAIRSRPRPGWPPAIRRRPAPAAGGGYVVQVSSQKNEADAQASFRALQGKYPAVLGSRSPLDQAGRSRREGRLLPRHGRTVRFVGRGLAVLRQPENRRRTVRRPKELTAVSLTPERARGLIGPMSSRAFITGVSGLELSAAERAFIRAERPWGFILFKRNIETPAQVSSLVAGIARSRSATPMPRS